MHLKALFLWGMISLLHSFPTTLTKNLYKKRKIKVDTFIYQFPEHRMCPATPKSGDEIACLASFWINSWIFIYLVFDALQSFFYAQIILSLVIRSPSSWLRCLFWFCLISLWMHFTKYLPRFFITAFLNIKCWQNSSWAFVPSL